jgi:hypothetical protein
MSAAALWDRLFEAGLVEGDPPPATEAPAPWYVRAMLGIAGWIAACFLIGFLGIALALGTHGASASGVGAVCCAAALFLLRQFDGQDFVEQLALAISLAGQGLIASGLSEILHGGGASLYLAFAVVEAVLVVAIPDFLHRALAAAGAGGAVALAFGDMALPGIASPILCGALALVWLEPHVWARRGALWRPIGYGAVLALLLTETFRLFGVGHELFGWRHDEAGWMALHGPLVGRIAAAAILVLVALYLARREGVERGSRLFMAIAGGAVLIGLVTIGAPGLAAALLILLLGFAAGSRLLVGVGVVSLLGFVSHFYYDLDATLLAKSGLMALAALLLLAIHLALRRMPMAPRETADA